MNYSPPESSKAKLNLEVGFSIPKHFEEQSYIREFSTGDRWTIEIGKAQSETFKKTLVNIFEKVSKTDNKRQKDFSLVFEPSLKTIEFSSPDRTGFEYYECWLNYSIHIYPYAEMLKYEWHVSGYGQHPKDFLTGHEEGLEEALKKALRSLAARILLDLPTLAVVKDTHREQTR